MRFGKLLTRNRRLWSIPLALMLMSSAASPVRADEEPDLKLEFVGLNGQREARFKITNVSVWWADETKLTVETTAPAAGNKVTLNVENLDPGQSAELVYRLAADCDGHVVQATVTPAKNYAGVPEANTANNQLKPTVCSAKKFEPGADVRKDNVAVSDVLAKPNTVEVVTGQTVDDVLDALKPEHMQRGVHMLEFRPSVTNVQSLHKYQGAASYTDIRESGDRRDGDSDVTAGWRQREAQTGDPVDIYQGLVDFDIAKLDEVERKVISLAVISFREKPIHWTNGEGAPEHKDGCVARLRKADEPWVGKSLQNHWVPSSNIIDDLIPGMVEVAVTGHVQRQQYFPDDPSLRYGYVFMGSLDDGTGDDDSSCVSLVENIRLRVTYTVLD
jgi:hypothetical protein